MIGEKHAIVPKDHLDPAAVLRKQRTPIQALGSTSLSHQEWRKLALRRGQSGVVRGGRREPVSRQPPRPDL
jgi:hypothetical protein